jgi:hypothetical protein
LEEMLKGQMGLVETWVGSVPVLTVCPRDGALGKRGPAVTMVASWAYPVVRLQKLLIIAGRDKILLA